MDLSDDDSEASGPTTSEVALFYTLPASAAPLSSSLMPRRHRERILEITKTVTVTEVVNNSARCHPGTCEVTVTNLDSGSGHPVSVNISHLHETVCQENGSGRCSPVVQVRETFHEETPTDTVEKVSSVIERILRVETDGDVSFKNRGDNVIDISFTTPVKPTSYPEINVTPDTTLYYHSFKKETTETANDLISPDSAVSDSPKRYMRSDDSDSDSGSLIIHSPVARPDSGVSSSVHRLNGKNLSISVGSSEEDDHLHYQSPSADSQPKAKNDRLPYYIVTAMSETVNSSQFSPNTTTFFADLDTSTATMNESTEGETRPHYKKRGSNQEGKEHRRSILVVTNVSSSPSETRVIEYDGDLTDPSEDWAETLTANDKRRRVTMEVLFTPPTPKENGVPPKPPRRTKYGPSQLVEHIQHYECSLDEMSEGPNMTSTPISTLQRHARKSADTIEEKKGEEEVKDKPKKETPIMAPRKISKPPALKSIQQDVERPPLTTPRRSPSSPIIVVDQERRSSMDLLVPPKQPRRKSTITDIDWFAAFNMKEPTTPKSPRSPMHHDALKEVEDAMNKRKATPKLKPIETKPLSPSKIDLDDVFSCSNPTQKDDKNCTCNACKLMKMSEEELKNRFYSLKRSPQTERKPLYVRSLSHEERRRKAPYADSDISIDDIFSPPKTKKMETHAEFYNERPEERVSPSVRTNLHDTVDEFPSSENKFKPNQTRSATLPPSDICLDDIFSYTVRPMITEKLEAKHYMEMKEEERQVHAKPEEIENVIRPAESDINLGNIFAGEPSINEILLDDTVKESHPAMGINLEEILPVQNEVLLENTVPETSKEVYAEVEIIHTKTSEEAGVEYIQDNQKNVSEPLTSDISMDEIFSRPTSPPKASERRYSPRQREAISPPRVQFREKENIKQVERPVGYVESDISIDDIFSPSGSSIPSSVASNNQEEPRKKKDQLASTFTKESDISIDEIFSPPTAPPKVPERRYNQRKREPSPPRIQFQRIEETKKLERPAGYVESDISIDDVFNPKTVETSSELPAQGKPKIVAKSGAQKEEPSPTVIKEVDISMDEIFSPPTFLPKAPERTKKDISRKELSPPRVILQKIEEPKKLERPTGYLESDISIDDIFNPRTSPEIPSSKEEQIKSIKEPQEKEVNLDEIFFQPTPPPKAPERRRHSPKRGEAISPPRKQSNKVEESKKIVKTIGYVDSDVSLEDVFSPKSVQQSSERLTVPRVSSPTATETSSISLDDIFSGKKDDQKENEKSEVIKEPERENPLKRPERRVPALTQQTSWLEELLKPNLTPNEEELKDSVRQLYEEVIPKCISPPERKETTLERPNDSIESGYTSLDRSKLIGTHDVSQTDSQVDLDTVFNPNNVGNNQLDKFELTSESGKARVKEEKAEEGFKTFPVDISLDETFPNISKKEEAVPRPIEITFGEEHRTTFGEEEAYVISSEEYQDLRKKNLKVTVESRRESLSECRTPSVHESLSEFPGTVKAKEKKSAETPEDLSWISSIVSKKQSRQDHSNTPELSPTSHILPSVSVQKPVDEKNVKNQKLENDSKVQEKSKNFSLIPVDWIEEMISDSMKAASDQKKSRGSDESTESEVPELENIISMVFDSPCSSPESGKKCTCSACKLTKMSSNELKEFWKKVKDIQLISIPQNEGTHEKLIKVDESKAFNSNISMEEVFYKPSGQKSEAIELNYSAVRETPPVNEPVMEQRDDARRSSSTVETAVVLNLDDIFPTKRTEDQAESKMESPAGNEENWLKEVLRSNSAEEEPDTFEASFLQSIKDIEKKNAEASKSYDNFYKEGLETFKKMTQARRHVDDYYDEPNEEEDVEEIDVGDLVDDILSSSLNEASFKIVSKNYNHEHSHPTDTSVDRKQLQSGSAMYLSTAGSDNRMESILSYPPSTSQPSPTTPLMPDTGEKFVSEASMTLSQPTEDDYIIRLVFANQNPEDYSSTPAVITESEIVTPETKFTYTTNYSTTLTETTAYQATSRPAWMQQRSMTDEEVLEVEVNQENFVIKGNYSIVINKHDPLGILLSELTAGSKALDFSVTPKIRRLLFQCLREKARPNVGRSLSSRAKNMLNREDPAYEVFHKMYSNQYSSENPLGNINLCTAENDVCNELLEERFRKNPEVFVPEYKHIMHYGPPGGFTAVKSKICEYLREEHSASIDESRVVLLSSGNATVDMLAHCLLDSDDVILTNAPTYSRNFVSIAERANSQLICVDLDLNNPRINVLDFEAVYEERTEKGENVRAIIVINPLNPLGVIFPPEDIKKLAHWAEEHGLWLIVDESFSQCIHDPAAKFDSFIKQQTFLPAKTVWFWSLSKDFGLPGIKLSIVQTNDRDLHHALSQLELTEPVSGLAQDFVANFLSDRDWLEKFKAEKYHRLRAHYKFTAENLRNLGIPFHVAPAGIFVFANFGEKLSAPTFEAEHEFWQSMIDKGIFMTPGSHTKCPQPGWMRLVFACEKDQLREGFRRLYEFFDSPSSIVGEINY